MTFLNCFFALVSCTFFSANFACVLALLAHATHQIVVGAQDLPWYVVVTFLVLTLAHEALLVVLFAMFKVYDPTFTFVADSLTCVCTCFKDLGRATAKKKTTVVKVAMASQVGLILAAQLVSKRVKDSERNLVTHAAILFVQFHLLVIYYCFLAIAYRFCFSRQNQV